MTRAGRRPSSITQDQTDALRTAVERGAFPGFDFRTAMRFMLSGGLAPASDLPVASLLRLDDFLREAAATATYTTTDLKNRTGTILDEVVRGRTVRLTRHGRVIAEMRPPRSAEGPSGWTGE